MNDDTSLAFDSGGICPAYTSKFPISFSRRHGVLAVGSPCGNAIVLTSQQPDPFLLDCLRRRLDCWIEVKVIDRETLQKRIDDAYEDSSENARHYLSSLEEESDRAKQRKSDLLDFQDSKSVVKSVNLILFDAIKSGASDVHLHPSESGVLVRLRIDGILYDYHQLPAGMLEEIVSRVKVLAGMDIAEKRLPQDGRTTVHIGQRRVDLRISTLPSSSGERVVMRLLDKSRNLLRLSDLGMEENLQRRFRNLVGSEHGLILVTGPTGSGKTTTLYAALQELNTTEKNVLTLEDPIEYELPGISQTQVNGTKGMTFASGLRTVLRQDPDIIMVGEIRDAATVDMAIQSALTGHLVFSTLHTNDAPGAIARLLDLGAEPFLVASALRCVLGQRLVRRICPKCRGLTNQIARGESLNSGHRGERCESCRNTGYRGRVGVFELLIADEAIRSLIQTRSSATAIRDAAMEAGFRSLQEDAQFKISNGITTTQELVRLTSSANYQDDEAS